MLPWGTSLLPMKRKPLLTLLCCALATSVVFAAAQTPGPTGTQGTLQSTKSGHKGGFNVRAWFKAEHEVLGGLNLTKDQQSQVDALDSKTKDNFRQIIKDTKTDKGARQEQVRALGNSYHQQLFAILTKDQQKEFRAGMKKWRDEQKAAKQQLAPTTTPPSTGTNSNGTTGGGH